MGRVGSVLTVGHKMEDKSGKNVVTTWTSCREMYIFGKSIKNAIVMMYLDACESHTWGKTQPNVHSIKPVQACPKMNVWTNRGKVGRVVIMLYTSLERACKMLSNGTGLKKVG